MILSAPSSLDASPVTFRCCVCFACLDSGNVFSFGGSFACEGCVRDYYKLYPESEIQLELRERRAEAVHKLSPKHRRSANLSRGSKKPRCEQCGHVAGTNPNCEECSL